MSFRNRTIDLRIDKIKSSFVRFFAFSFEKKKTTNFIFQDELATTAKVYEEQIGMMSDHLASLNKQLSSQNEQIDKLQQQLHHNPKVNRIEKIFPVFRHLFLLGREKK